MQLLPPLPPLPSPPSAETSASGMATNDHVIAIIPNSHPIPCNAVATSHHNLAAAAARSDDVTRKCLKCYNSSVEQEMQRIVTETV